MMTAIDFQAYHPLATAILLINNQGQILYANPAAQALFCRSEKSLKQSSLWGYFAPTNHYKSVITQALLESKSLSLNELRVAHDTPKPYHRDSVEPIVHCQISPHCDYYFVELIQNDWRSLNENAPQDQRNKAQSMRMLNEIAHEIKNPLAGIRGAAQLLQRQLRSLDIQKRDYQDYIQIIIKESDRLNQWLDRLTGHAEQHFLPLNVHKAIEHVYILLNSSGSTLSIKRDYDPSLPDVLADKSALIQVLLNLGRNAIEAFESVDPSQAPEIAPQLIFRTRLHWHKRINDIAYKKLIRIDVIDNGSGIDDALLPQIFDPLFSTKAHGKGLGLSIANDIMAQHHGCIEVAPLYPGTRFSLFIPILNTTHKNAPKHTKGHSL